MLCLLIIFGHLVPTIHACKSGVLVILIQSSNTTESHNTSCPRLLDHCLQDRYPNTLLAPALVFACSGSACLRLQYDNHSDTSLRGCGVPVCVRAQEETRAILALSSCAQLSASAACVSFQSWPRLWLCARVLAAGGTDDRACVCVCVCMCVSACVWVCVCM